MVGLESIIIIFKNGISALLSWIPKIKDIFRNKNISNKALIIVDSDTGYQNYWHVGSQNGKPILQFVCNFMATNITDLPVALANAILKGVKGDQDLAMISVKDVNSQYSGSYEIPPRGQTAVSICFIAHPRKMPISGQPIKLKVGVIDQFGNRYWVKNILFELLIAADIVWTLARSKWVLVK